MPNWSHRKARTLCLPHIEVYFSGVDPIGFYTSRTGYIISENLWGDTTLKHLNQITGAFYKKTPHKEFTVRLEENFYIQSGEESSWENSVGTKVKEEN
jgi:hypothetical protein